MKVINAFVTADPLDRWCQMTKPSEIDEWTNKALRYRELVSQATSQATRSLLEALAREAERMAEDLAEGGAQ